MKKVLKNVFGMLFAIFLKKQRNLMKRTNQTQLKKIVAILKNRVYTNIKTIESNDIKVKSILTEPVSELRTSRLKKWLDKNQELMEQNKELISLQLTILGCLSKYESEKNKLGAEDTLAMTIRNILPTDNRHSLSQDREFKNSLLEFYQNIEDYETCAKLAR